MPQAAREFCVVVVVVMRSRGLSLLDRRRLIQNLNRAVLAYCRRRLGGGAPDELDTVAPLGLPSGELELDSRGASALGLPWSGDLSGKSSSSVPEPAALWGSCCAPRRRRVDRFESLAPSSPPSPKVVVLLLKIQWELWLQAASGSNNRLDIAIRELKELFGTMCVSILYPTGTP